MTEQLADKQCVPCRGGVPPLKGKELEKLHQNVPKWMVYDEHQLHREFKFPDFKQALEFVNRVGAWPRSRDIIPTFCWPGAKSRSRCGRIKLTA